MVNVKIGKRTTISHFTNLYGCDLGDDVFVGPFVEIQKNCKIGNKTRISSHSFICEGVEIGENCFIAHGVMFTNDKFTENKEEWILRKTKIGKNVRIGSNATILPVVIGDNCIIGAGSVVTKDLPNNSLVYGNPATIKKI
jgi:acetyltransferase-like isoleucine patch superfamily enzyme